MNNNNKTSLKRFGRCLLGNIIGGAVAGGLFYLKGEPVYVFLSPIIAAGVNAIGKWLRAKFNVNSLPF